MLQIYALYDINNNSGQYVLIEPYKIESITIYNRSYDKKHSMWVIKINTAHYKYELMNKENNSIYWDSYDEAINELKKIGLYNI